METGSFNFCDPNSFRVVERKEVKECPPSDFPSPDFFKDFVNITGPSVQKLKPDSAFAFGTSSVGFLRGI